MTRERAEALVKELVKAGEVKKGKASKVIEEVLERSRRGTEELVQIVRREIGEQVSALGLATKHDLADLEARLAGTAGTTAATATAATATATEPPVVDPVPGTAVPSGDPPDAGAGEARVSGARAVGVKKAAKKAARRAAPPPVDPPSAQPGAGG